MASKKCPNCGLLNLETATRCDCGYDFPSGQMKESYLNKSSLDETLTSHQNTEKMSLSEILFSFDGRISRSTYWLKFTLPLGGLGIVATILDMAMGTFDYENGVGLLSAILSLAAIYPSVAVGV